MSKNTLEANVMHSKPNLLLRLGLCFVLLLMLQLERAHASYPNNVNDADDESGSKFSAATAGVTGWQVSEPYINLWLFDQPISYETSFNQPIGFAVAFKQRDNRSNSKIFGLGPGWEANWLSYVEYTTDTASPPHITVGTNYVSLGGARMYVGDGVTKEFKSSSTMTVLTNGGGALTGFQINYPSGARDIYSYLFTVSTNENYAFLSQQIDSVSHTNTLNYDTISSVVRLRSMVDTDNRTNSVAYDATFTSQISEVDGPYGTKANFVYDGSGRLTTITNVGGMSDTFSYDSQSLVTNLVTAYGTTSFKATTNAFAPYNLGGTNQVNRSLLVTEPDGGNQLVLYRDQSTKLYPGSSVDLIPSSYPGGDVPSTSPLSNTLDNSWMDARNSFRWNQNQYSGLNATFRSTGAFSDLTTNDYNVAMLSHWLRGYTNATVVTDTLSLRRDASPDGTTQGGQKMWFDYSGKVTNAYTRGTNAAPLFVALVLPDGTTRYNYSERNKWEKPSRIVTTYTTGGGVGIRTNNFTFTSDAIDIVQALGPSGELLSSNAYNGFHQVVTNFNAVNDLTVYTYDSGHRLTGIQAPIGLVTTNYYFTVGSHVGWLSSMVDYETTVTNAYRTNAFTYTNGLVYTSTDPRGLISTNTYDALRRLTSVVIPSGTLNNQYSNLNLTKAIGPSGCISNLYVFDPMQRVCQRVDPRASSTSFCYMHGLLCTITNALNETNSFTYDFNGRQLTTTFADGSTATKRYDLLGQFTNSVDAGGVSLTNWFNNQGLLFASSNGFGQVFLKSFDIRDRVTNAVDANGVTLVTTYDNLSRMLTRTYPDGGVEKYQYSARGLINYTNQLGFVTAYGYDALGRKIAETNANGEVTRYSYSPGSDLIQLVDGKSHSTQWGYDVYGRNTNVIDATSTTVLRFNYDADGRLTNRWSAAKGDTFYTVDLNGNVTLIDYPNSPDVSFTYDVLNRATTMTDAAGTSAFGYTSLGMLSTEDGPWDGDTVTLTYGNSGGCGCSQGNHLRTGLSLQQPNASSWNVSYAYDNANRLQTLTAPSGGFTYSYQAGSLIKKLQMPNGAYITNTFDSVARRTATTLENSGNSVLNSHSYTYDLGSRRTRQTRTDGSYVDYGYDSIGQLKSGTGKESGGSSRAHENFGYVYDAADNLQARTNNVLVQSFSVDSLNQLSSASRSGTLTVAGTAGSPGTNLTSVTVADNGNSPASATLYGDKTFARTGVTVLNGTNTFTAVASDAYGRSSTNTVTVNLPSSPSYSYDLNGNLTSDGVRSFAYDDENQLTSVSATGSWWSSFVYDGRNRMRIRREYVWQSSAWVQTSEARYIYDGSLVIQERDGNNTPTVTYTRGLDLSGPSSCSGSFEGAGGIGGLLSRTDNFLMMVQNGEANTFYHADGNGNVTMLVNNSQLSIAKYLYDPFGNLIGKTGVLSEANVYRFSSKEYSSRSGLYYFGRRFYDPNVQRWINRDPKLRKDARKLFDFVSNSPQNLVDPIGLWPWGAWNWPCDAGQMAVCKYRCNPHPFECRAWEDTYSSGYAWVIETGFDCNCLPLVPTGPPPPPTHPPTPPPSILNKNAPPSIVYR